MQKEDEFMAPRTRKDIPAGVMALKQKRTQFVVKQQVLHRGWSRKV